MSVLGWMHVSLGLFILTAFLYSWVLQEAFRDKDDNRTTEASEELKEQTGQMTQPESMDMYDNMRTEPIGFKEAVLEYGEKTLVRWLFEEIRDNTYIEEEGREIITGYEMKMVDKYGRKGCMRVDAGGETANNELIDRAIQKVERESGRLPREEGWEIWMHPLQKREWYEDLNVPTRYDEGLMESYMDISIIEVSAFPETAILLWEPENSIDSIHTVGSNKIHALEIVRPSLICRITGMGRPEQ